MPDAEILHFVDSDVLATVVRDQGISERSEQRMVHLAEGGGGRGHGETHPGRERQCAATPDQGEGPPRPRFADRVKGRAKWLHIVTGVPPA